ncbi:phosphoglycerate mutase family protein [Dictyocaulus viviparus]|uniref:Protein UBASH3A homolog n=1 Tax=Dictyocaulus viviparus TaxID=29172 RepID=A0A0D8X7U9_DICVI|nr:phosphoglycerate mutase family protein [Dictyocaulus viviparus]
MSGRNMIVVRHGERCDFVFNNGGESWVQKAFDSNGRYCPVDINMPRMVPKRKDGWEHFVSDTPLTEMGYIQSKLTGRALKDAGIKIDYVYCSSALRCVQTAVGIMKGFGVTSLINVEPGLFEWMQWCRGNRPSWMQVEELKKSGYSVNVDYVPIMEASSLPLDESLSSYYERSYSVTKEILQRHSCGTVLLVAHGASLDTCTRQLCGADPRSIEQFFYLLQNTPYLACVGVTEVQSQWKITDSPIAPLTHSMNASYNPKQLTISSSSLQERMRIQSR